MISGNPWTPGLFVPNRRSIGGIVAQVTIEEREHDELFITEHPIEQGAPINDHAFKRPSEVNIRAGWSAGNAGDLSANGNGVYGLLLSWQAALNPFDLYTGKRVYHNMLIQSIVVTTNKESEFALMADITCRQVIIVRTQTAQDAISSDTTSQKEPEKTATSDDKGTADPRNVGSGDSDLLAGGGTPPPDAASDSSASVVTPVTVEGTKVETTVGQNTNPESKFGPPVASAVIPPPPLNPPT